MRVFLFILLLLASSSNILKAQNSSDFELRVENSFLKLFDDPDVAIHAAKEIRSEDDQLLTTNILTKAYLLKGDYVESVKITFEKSTSQKHSEELQNNLVLARQFHQLNLYEQTAKIIKLAISVDFKKNNANNSRSIYAQLFQLQARNFLALKNYEAAEKSLLKSSEYVDAKTKISEMISQDNQLIKAEIAWKQKNFSGARDKIDELSKDLKPTSRYPYLQSSLEQLKGNLFFEDQDYENAAQSLENALRIITAIDYEPLKNSIHSDLAKSYLAAKKLDSYEIYKTKFEKSSELLENQKNEARRELIQLITESDRKNQKTIKEKKEIQILYIAILSIFILTIPGYFYYHQIAQVKTLHKQIKFFRSLNSNQPTAIRKEIKTKDVIKKTLFIPKEKEEELLLRLEQFEESKKYLDNNMSLATLAATLETNTKYLSEIINKYKDKNFNTYINELRVKHVVQLLSTDPTYLQYKISYIAEIGGFTSHSAFTNVFKSVTGFSPNEYIQNLKNSE